MESGFAVFFEQLKDPLLMLMAVIITALSKAYISERKERIQKDKEKDEQFKELSEFGKDLVKLTTMWEVKAEREFKRSNEVEKKADERYEKIIQLYYSLLAVFEKNKDN